MLLKSYNGQPIPGTDQVSAGAGELSFYVGFGSNTALLHTVMCTHDGAQQQSISVLLRLLQVFRLNWAAYGVGKAQPAGEGTMRISSMVTLGGCLLAACRPCPHA